MGILKIYPKENFDSEYDDIEIDAISHDEDCIDDPENNPDDIAYWSVFLHDVRGGRECIADVETQTDAMKFASLIEHLNLPYKQLTNAKH